MSKPQLPSKKIQQQRDIFREDLRDRDRDRDRRQPSGNLSVKDNQDLDGQGKRSSNKRQDEKKEIIIEKKDSSISGEVKKESSEAAWNRKAEPKISNWADAVSPTFEKEEEDKRSALEHKDDNKSKMSEIKQVSVNELKHGVEKMSIDSKKNDTVDKDVDVDKDDKQLQQRDKNMRNRAGSGTTRGQRSSESSRGSNRQWASERGPGPNNAYSGGSNRERWRAEPSGPLPPPPTRGGRRGGSRSMGGSRKPGYERTDEELSSDELGPMHDPSQPTKARSPKPSAPKAEKDERNRNQAAATASSSNNLPAVTAPPSQNQAKVKENIDRGEFSSSRNDKRPEGGRTSCREGFAPSGEPSRRGRGGFRNNASNSTSSRAAPVISSSSGSAAGGRMEGYGPPPSKSPFSTDNRSVDSHDSNKQQSGSEHHDESASEQSADGKISKQHALTTGVNRHAKSPNNSQVSNHNATPLISNSQQQSARPPKEKSKRTRSGSRRGGRGGGPRGMSSKQNFEHGNDEWETTSDNSEELPIDGHGPSNRSNKPYRGGQNAVDNRIRGERHREPRGGDKGPKPNAPSNRGSEKTRNAQNMSDRGPQRNHNIPPLMSTSQLPNGRPRSQGSANAGPMNSIKVNKEMAVNRMDDIKLNDPNLVNQAMNDINVKKSKDKRSGINDHDTDNCTDDASGLGMQDDCKVDSDGFQEVRSKKNVKDSSRMQQQKEETQQASKSVKRERSKSKTNGPPRSGDSSSQPAQQNISPLMGSQGSSQSKQPFESRVNNRKLPPRLQKQRIAKQQAVSSDSVDVPNVKQGVIKDAVVPAPPVMNAWEKPFTVGSGSANRSPPSPAIGAVSTDAPIISGLIGTGQSAAIALEHEPSQALDANVINQRSSPDNKIKLGAIKEPSISVQDKGDTSSPPVQTLIFENTNYSKSSKSNVGPTGEMAMKSKYSGHIKSQRPDNKRSIDEENESSNQLQQQQALVAAFTNKQSDLSMGKEKQQEPMSMPISFPTSTSSANVTSNAKPEDNSDMKLDFTFDSDLSQLTEDKTKTSSSNLGIPRSSMHITSSVQSSTISPSTADLNLKIASVKKVWENATMPTVVEHEVVDPNSVVSSAAANFVNQSFVEAGDCDDGYGVAAAAAAAAAAAHQYGQASMKSDISASSNVCKVSFVEFVNFYLKQNTSLHHRSL